MRYTFDYYQPFHSNNPSPAWHVTKIQDKFGNTLHIDYYSGTTRQALVREISASDGRSVTFHYNDLNQSTVRLSEVRLNGNWRAQQPFGNPLLFGSCGTSR